MDKVPSFNEMALAVAVCLSAAVSAIVVAVAVTVAVRTFGKHAPWLSKATNYVWAKLIGDPWKAHRRAQILDAVDPLMADVRADLAAMSTTLAHINGAVNNTPPGEPTLSQVARQTHYVVLGHTAQLIELSGTLDDLQRQVAAGEAIAADTIARVAALEATPDVAETDDDTEDADEDADAVV